MPSSTTSSRVNSKFATTTCSAVEKAPKKSLESTTRPLQEVPLNENKKQAIQLRPTSSKSTKSTNGTASALISTLNRQPSGLSKSRLFDQQ
jgi:hypothetical protein